MTAPRPREAECQATIVAAALTLGYLVHAERPARSERGWRTPVQGSPGFPDLVIAGHGRVIVAELKRPGNRVEPAQQAWLDALSFAGVDARVVWVPDGQQSFIDELAGIAAEARAS